LLSTRPSISPTSSSRSSRISFNLPHKSFVMG
jgi:hypothetical protein